jgi:BTB/POZ domain
LAKTQARSEKHSYILERMSANDINSLEAVLGKALVLQQEAARMGHKLSVSAGGRFMTLPLPWAASDVSLDECTADEARALVDNVKHADCVLQIGDACYHAHTQLLKKRSKFFQGLLDTDIDNNNPVFELDKMPNTEKYGFRAFLDYLYTGEIPSQVLLSQYSIAIALNAHYADCEELYEACVNYIASKWRDVKSANPNNFATDVTVLLMEDVVKQMPIGTFDALRTGCTSWQPVGALHVTLCPGSSL